MSVTIKDLQAHKREGRRFVMLTAYDFTTAQILDEAGVPVILVGDSLGMTMLGYPNTLAVTMEEMLHHTRAVRRGVANALVVGHKGALWLKAAVFGLSTQTTEYQHEMASRLNLPFEILSDANFRLTDTLRLPTFNVRGVRLLKRLTFIIQEGHIEHVFYPIFPPDQSATEVLDWLKDHPLQF